MTVGKRIRDMLIIFILAFVALVILDLIIFGLEFEAVVEVTPFTPTPLP